MKRLLICVLIGFPFLAICQSRKTENYSLQWSEGFVVFNSQDTVACPLRYIYSATTSLLQIKHEDEVVTVSPDHVKAFQFYDADNLKWRKFASVPVDSVSKRSVFMQTLYADSDFAVLSHRTTDVAYSYMHYAGLLAKHRLTNKKYIYDAARGKLLPLSKETVLSLMADKRHAIDIYIKSKHLTFRRTGDYIEVLKFSQTL